MKYLSIISLLIFILPDTGKCGWVKDTIGYYGWLYEVKVGDGRNDGVQRVYCATLDGHVIELTCEFGSWIMADCGVNPGGRRIIGLWIGNGRRDGLNRIYGASSWGNLYEYTYDDSIWVIDSLGSPGAFYAGVTMGNIRNDDTIRICSAGYQIPICEYTWNGFNWDTMDICQVNRDIWPMGIGKGRNDGYERIYCPDYTNSFLREYSWNGVSFDEDSISSNLRLGKVVVGPGRNDGINRVYGSEIMGHINEFSYGSGIWSNLDIQPGAQNLPRFGMCLGRAKSDGQVRLYSNAVTEAVREHSWNGSMWVDTVIDAISGATADLTIGPGRNDDTMRIYTTGDNGYIMEYTNTSPYAGIEQTAAGYPQRDISVLPNPFTRLTHISYTLPNDNIVKLCIYDLLGREVYRLIDEFQTKGFHTVTISSKSIKCMNLSAGVYLIKLDCGKMQSVRKIIIIN